MITWRKLPRGSYTYSPDNIRVAYVWYVVCVGYQWNVIDGDTGIYLDCGIGATLDEACEMALKTLKV